jgi:protease-4
MTKFLAIFAAVGALAISGCGTPSILLTPVFNANAPEEVTVQPAPKDAEGAGGKIAMIDLSGVIMNAHEPGLLGVGENGVDQFASDLRRAADDSDVKAVVIRINSPGGSVSASDALYEEVVRFKAQTHKPVIAAVQDVGASGAYYVACASDTIIVAPTSIVGSIGVIFESFNVAGTMAKLGIVSDPVKSAKNKDAGSPFREMTPDERQIFQHMIDTYYARFKGIVQSRATKVPADKTEEAFDGRVYTGTDAVEIGLANKTGQLYDALNTARTMAHAPRAKVIMYKPAYANVNSIYATTPVDPARAAAATPATALTVKLPGFSELPPGFYYLWQP